MSQTQHGHAWGQERPGFGNAINNFALKTSCLKSLCVGETIRAQAGIPQSSTNPQFSSFMEDGALEHMQRGSAGLWGTGSGGGAMKSTSSPWLERGHFIASRGSRFSLGVPSHPKPAQGPVYSLEQAPWQEPPVHSFYQNLTPWSIGLDPCSPTRKSHSRGLARALLYFLSGPVVVKGSRLWPRGLRACMAFSGLMLDPSFLTSDLVEASEDSDIVASLR